MAANAEQKSGTEWMNLLLPLSGHIHISDAFGADGEGVGFGKGELNLDETKVMSQDCVKVVEQWEGHLNSFYGFRSALAYLEHYL